MGIDQVQRNPAHPARNGRCGFEQKEIPGVDLRNRLGPHGHAPGPVEMDYKFPGEENSKSANESDLAGASILHRMKGFEDHSCVGHTLEVLVGPGGKPLRVEIV